MQGETAAEAEDRATKVATQLKMLDGGEVLEERESRVLGELASLPGNGQFGLRPNIITSKNVGDLAMVYRLAPGDKTPFLLFGDRKGGVFAYSLFTRREPSWNKAVLGLPGSREVDVDECVPPRERELRLARVRPRQGQQLRSGVRACSQAEMPEDVAVMRLARRRLSGSTLFRWSGRWMNVSGRKPRAPIA